MADLEQGNEQYDLDFDFDDLNSVNGLFGTETTATGHCVRCEGSIPVKKTRSFTTKLAYPQTLNPVSFCSLLERSLNGRHQSNIHCESCAKQTTTMETKHFLRLPRIFIVEVPFDSDTDRRFWTTQLTHFEMPYLSIRKNARQKMPGNQNANEETNFRHYLPLKMSLRLEDQSVRIVNGRDENEQSIDYCLESIVYSINDADEQQQQQQRDMQLNEHLITAIRIEDQQSQGTDQWVVFNEFVVTKVSSDEVLHLDVRWKTPRLLYFVAKQSTDKIEDPHENVGFSLDESIFCSDECLSVSRRSSSSTFVLLDEHEMSSSCSIVAIDAEFVSLNTEESDVGVDSNRPSRQSQTSVARISCIRGNGPNEGLPFIDDYITTQEKVHDYLTKFSGIEPNDLDPSLSTKHLTTLKSTYLKLLFLIDRDVIFVGHGLRNDFRVINIYVPPEQIKDTVHLFHLPHQRMVSLRFLAWHLLDLRIQSKTHDSIEDARTALKLYKKYLQLEQQGRGTIDKTLNNLYENGKRLNWQLPGDEP